jgi:RimJ/RimL family protein N-acetyltransferase
LNLRATRKRSFRKRILPAILRRVRWIGIRIEPFLIVREGETPVNFDQRHNAFSFSVLTAADIEELVRFDPGTERDKLRSWFQEGKLCYGVRNASLLVAKMWCDLKEFNYPPNYRKLAHDEVYLFAARAHPDYRGQNLAPLMRIACYASLRKMGRTRFYSYTDYFNTAARRFKAKLGARDEALRLHIALFGKWSKTLTLRQYS